jgi:hypothetical protein
VGRKCTVNIFDNLPHSDFRQLFTKYEDLVVDFGSEADTAVASRFDAVYFGQLDTPEKQIASSSY